MNLWLDDVRDPVEHGYIGYLWVKTYEEAIEVLSTGRVLCASLDHDLGICSTLGMHTGEKTGYDVVCWMEEHNIWPRYGVRVHSVNPAGKTRMEAAIRRAYGRNFR